MNVSIDRHSGQKVQVPEAFKQQSMTYGLRTIEHQWTVPFDRLLKHKIKEGLQGFEVEIFTTVPSTHLYGYYLKFPKPFSIYLAEYQSKGIGRKHDPWVSKYADNILMTLMLPNTKEKNIPKKVIDALSNKIKSLIPDHRISIKQPNDIMIDGAKCLGMMIQEPMHSSDCLMISVGLNVNMIDSGPKDQPWTSLYLISQSPWDRNYLVCEVVKALTASLNL